MLRIFASGLLAIALIPLPTAAQDADFRTIKCKDFLALPDGQKAPLLLFIAGYHAGKNGEPILYRAKIVKLGTTIGAHCIKNREDDVMKASESQM